MLWYTQAIIVGTLFPSAGAIIYQQQQQQDDRELMIHDGEEILKPSVPSVIWVTSGGHV